MTLQCLLNRFRVGVNSSRNLFHRVGAVLEKAQVLASGRWAALSRKQPVGGNLRALVGTQVLIRRDCPLDMQALGCGGHNHHFKLNLERNWQPM